MASLNKLAIRGIRSFDDKQVSVIEFFSPVTVIVGHNGSGKTTIIECLKYATTGDQPPNTRGGAFVHDPKMANEKEVKAQVKLRFFAANGQRMLAVRNLSVTAKKTAGLTMKTLESILAIDDGEKSNKRATISTKCAEMDVEIPQLLGVSKAVLENVIFCHQEESYWPLAEPSALKKKFDDIFEATRYTKALENIRTLRKDRVSDLKAEKERLESLAKEKAHAEKLRKRITELTSAIHAKEITYEETKKEYEEQVAANVKFQEYARRFREVYLKFESLEERKKGLEEDYDEARTNIADDPASDEELQRRIDQFDENILSQKTERRKAGSHKQDLEEELENGRTNHVSLVKQLADLNSEAKQQQQRLKDRETLIREIAQKFKIATFGPEPLDGSKIIEFMSKLDNLKQKQSDELETLQAERKAEQEEYNKNSRALTAASEKYKADRGSLRQQMGERTKSITKGERELETLQELPSRLTEITNDREEKTRRFDKLKTEIEANAYETKLSANSEKKTIAEGKREKLNQEFVMLNREAESRARLNLKRKEISSKKAEVEQKQLVGKAASADTLETLIEDVAKEKNDELELAEADASDANAKSQRQEALLQEKKNTLKLKQREMKDADRHLKSGLENNESLEEALKDAQEELHFATEESGSGASKVYEKLLDIGRQQKKCNACTRHMEDNELRVFEKHLLAEIKRYENSKKAEDNKNAVQGWKEELARLQGLVPIQLKYNTLKIKEIPETEAEVVAAEAKTHEYKESAEAASEKLASIKAELREIQAVREYGKTVGRLQKEVERLTHEVSGLENELAASGSTKSTEDVQNEIEALSNEIRALEKEANTLIRDRDRQNGQLRTFEGDLHRLEVAFTKVSGKLKEKEYLEQQVEQWKKDIVDMTERVKDIDQRIAEAQAPIDALDAEHKTQQREIESKLSKAGDSAQQFNRSADKLADLQKLVERYVQQRREQRHRECESLLEDSTVEIKRQEKLVEEARERIAKIDKEINESGSSLLNLRENIRLRKLAKQIRDTQTEMDSYDMDEAARAKRTFGEQWSVKQKIEEKLQQKFSHIGGEISSHKSQLEIWESDGKEFIDVFKHYKEQLIKVKMSDMANNDLEKYAKALENAIMKYHTLKMEEVNDTMRHLWNKTYQGTDIDGIKIRSDVEGGATKRSYNYRVNFLQFSAVLGNEPLTSNHQKVVMTKDQVEMDMRGRCSAGQKMLASIIIRLALSDSFGQNCGILALDEPTNALDTENIEALASSLVDIINERKNHANFQLIIITHDENFLRKLGQSDVMEYYWRVSRDARQKSVTERQRVK
ncbi:hypothetical protein D9757_005521 [Collybiopsis confluens]|uniref:DNA repair protein RAD50 n=1 Tax=Collybiopsis confluens TaxID=2823264 RepID=A0A8H5HLJ0_9AGAR|nr:hypothetical protein D9757_005521 [Collybiopsis confluens]